MKRGIFILPSLFTLTALFAGFYAIVAGMQGMFEHAAVAIFVAMVMDALDGRVARLTNTTSAFGAELDSLCDMVSFGVAPALVIYSYALANFGKIGWLIAFFYTAAGALRLARFNSQAMKEDRKYFQGLPIPAAAGVIAGVVCASGDWGWHGMAFYLMIAVLTLMVSFLMPSTIRYHSFKDFHFKESVPFVTIVSLVIVFILIVIEPAQVLFAAFVLYAFSGPVISLWQVHKKRKTKTSKRGMDGSN